MRLNDFLECFDLDTPILILDKNRVIIEENVVGEVTQRTMNQREVLRAYHKMDKLVMTTYRKECAEDVM